MEVIHFQIFPSLFSGEGDSSVYSWSGKKQCFPPAKNTSGWTKYMRCYSTALLRDFVILYHD